MPGKIKLISSTDAQALLFEKLQAVAGMKVALFSGTVKKFIGGLYQKGYVFGQVDELAAARLKQSYAKGNVALVSKIEFFVPERGIEVLFAQAEMAAIPVAAIKPDMTNFCRKIYQEGLVFGRFHESTMQAKFAELTQAGKQIELTFGGEETNGKVAPTQPAGNDTPASSVSGSGDETGGAAS